MNTLDFQEIGLREINRTLQGLDNFRQTAIDWLSHYDDGKPTTPGPHPD